MMRSSVLDRILLGLALRVCDLVGLVPEAKGA